MINKIIFTMSEFLINKYGRELDYKLSDYVIEGTNESCLFINCGSVGIYNELIEILNNMGIKKYMSNEYNARIQITE